MNQESETTFANMFFSISIASIAAIITVRNLEKVSNLFYDFMTKYPGVGTLTSKNNSVSVCTEIGDVYLPLLKLSSLDIDIYFFEDQQVDENVVFKDYVFDELLKDSESFNLKRYGTSVIKNISRPSDFKGKSQISGYLRSFLDDKVLVFTIKNNEIIDYDKLMNEFTDCNYEETEDEENEEDDDYQNVKNLMDELSKTVKK